MARAAPRAKDTAAAATNTTTGATTTAATSSRATVVMAAATTVREMTGAGLIITGLRATDMKIVDVIADIVVRPSRGRDMGMVVEITTAAEVGIRKVDGTMSKEACVSNLTPIKI